jgi:hypothetical protein
MRPGQYSALAALLAACSAPAERARVEFSRSEYMLLTAVPTKAADYVPNSKLFVPDVVRSCGGKDVSYHEATDWGGFVAFTPTLSRRETEGCVHRALPQVIFQPLPND